MRILINKFVALNQTYVFSKIPTTSIKIKKYFDS